MTGPIPKQFDETSPPPNFKPDFTTPEKAVETVYEAARWGRLDLVKLGMSKALLEAVEGQKKQGFDDWKLFFAERTKKFAYIEVGPR